MIHIIQIERLLVIIFISWAIPSFSQETPGRKVDGDTSKTMSSSENTDLSERPKNNIFINILGDGSLASLNYERLLFANPKHFFVAAGGGGGVNSLVAINSTNGTGTNFSTKEFMVIPHHITGNIGGGKHFFEFGAGGTYLVGNHPRSYLPYLIAGYRLQPKRINKVHFRLFGSYPLASIEEFDLQFIPVGISVGLSF